MRQMADISDDGIVSLWGFANGRGTESLPKFGDGLSGIGIGVFERRDEANALDEEFRVGVFHAGLFGSCHRVGAYESSLGVQCGRASAAQFAFDAANVGYDWV